MNNLFNRISDARAKNPVKVIGLTAMISGLLLLTFPVGLAVTDLIEWPSDGTEDVFGLFVLVLSEAGIFGLLVTFMMLLGQFMDMSHKKSPEKETAAMSQRGNYYPGRSRAHGELNEYEKDALECQMFHDSFMIAHGQNPLDYGDWVDHVTDPFGFGDD